MSEQTQQRILKGVQTTLKNPTTFARSGYELLGYSTNKSATTPSFVDGTKYKFTANTLLYAVWGALGWSINYNMNGRGQVPSGARLSYSPSDLPYIPPEAKNVYDATTQKTYLFNGWSPELIDVGTTGNQSFNASWVEATNQDPGFMQVAILDTSGSMETVDYRNASVGLAASLYEYLNEEAAYAKTRVFYGTYITNVQEETDYIKDFDISKATFSDACSLVQDTIYPGIKAIPKVS